MKGRGIVQGRAIGQGAGPTAQPWTNPSDYGLIPCFLATMALPIVLPLFGHTPALDLMQPLL